MEETKDNFYLGEEEESKSARLDQADSSLGNPSISIVNAMRPGDDLVASVSPDRSRLYSRQTETSDMLMMNRNSIFGSVGGESALN